MKKVLCIFGVIVTLLSFTIITVSAVDTVENTHLDYNSMPFMLFNTQASGDTPLGVSSAVRISGKNLINLRITTTTPFGTGRQVFYYVYFDGKKSPAEVVRADCTVIELGATGTNYEFEISNIEQPENPNAEIYVYMWFNAVTTGAGGICAVNDMYITSSSYAIAYGEGYQEGLNYGLTASWSEAQRQIADAYSSGYSKGLTSASSENMVFDAVCAVIFAVPKAIYSLLNFDLFGINLLAVFGGIIAVLLIIKIIEMIKGV